MNLDVKRWAKAVSPGFAKPLWDRLEASPLGYRLVRGAFWSVAGTVLSKGLTLAASIVVARLVGKGAYGDLGMVQTTVAGFAAFAGFSLGVTATKYVAEFRLTNAARAGRIIALSNAVAWITSVLVALVLFFLAPWLAQHNLHAPRLQGLLRISALLLLLGGVSGAQTGILAGFEAFKLIARINCLVGVVSFPVLVVGTYFGGVPGAVWALVANAAVLYGLNRQAIRQEARRAGVPLSVSHWFQEWPILWKFSLPAVLANIMVGPVHWACTAMLYNLPKIGDAEMGVFSAADRWFFLLLLVPNLVGQCVLPLMSERLAVADKLQSRRLLGASIGLNALIVTPVLLVLAAASPLIMRLYGHGFAGGATTLVIVLCTAGLLALQTPVGQLIVASGNIWPGFLMNVGWAVAYLIGTKLLVGYGANGLAGARLIAYGLHASWTFWYAFHLLRKS